MIQVEGLIYDYPTARALKGVNLHVASGSVTARRRSRSRNASDLPSEMAWWAVRMMSLASAERKIVHLTSGPASSASADRRTRPVGSQHSALARQGKVPLSGIFAWVPRVGRRASPVPRCERAAGMRPERVKRTVRKRVSPRTHWGSLGARGVRGGKNGS